MAWSIDKPVAWIRGEGGLDRIWFIVDWLHGQQQSCCLLRSASVQRCPRPPPSPNLLTFARAKRAFRAAVGVQAEAGGSAAAAGKQLRGSRSACRGLLHREGQRAGSAWTTTLPPAPGAARFVHRRPGTALLAPVASLQLQFRAGRRRAARTPACGGRYLTSLPKWRRFKTSWWLSAGKWHP